MSRNQRLLALSVLLFLSVTVWTAIVHATWEYWGFWGLFFSDFLSRPWIRGGLVQVFVVLLLAEASVLGQNHKAEVSFVTVTHDASIAATTSVLFTLIAVPGLFDGDRNQWPLLSICSLFVIHMVIFKSFKKYL